MGLLAGYRDPGPPCLSNPKEVIIPVAVVRYYRGTKNFKKCPKHLADRIRQGETLYDLWEECGEDPTRLCTC